MRAVGECPAASDAELLLDPDDPTAPSRLRNVSFRALALRRLGAAGLLLGSLGLVAGVPWWLRSGSPPGLRQAPSSPRVVAKPSKDAVALNQFQDAAPAVPLAAVAPDPNPFAVENSIGGGDTWQKFATADEAFAYLDKNKDGILTFKGDHLERLRNYTVGVPKGVFEMYFNTEKLKLLNNLEMHMPTAMGAVDHFNALSARAVLIKKLKEPRKMELTVGPESKLQRLVNELYTFGAPGTAPVYLYDATRPMGCFQGLRTFSRGQRYMRTFGGYFTISDPVSWITSVLNYDHAKMEALEAEEHNDKEDTIHPCNASFESVVMTPKSDNFWWFGGHTLYEGVLKAHVNYDNNSEWVLRHSANSVRAVPAAMRSRSQKVERAYLMSHWAFINYQPDTQVLHLDARDWGWTLVGRACSGKHGFWAPRCRDHLALFQDDKTLECVFSFEGSDDILDWISDVDVFVEDFCGFGHVHRGFKFKLMSMVQGIDYRQTILPKLPYCKGVTVVGHSLGGAQAELFTACANKGLKQGQPGYEDHRYIAWQKGTPARLPAYFDPQVQGTYYLRNSGDSGSCIDVRGTMETKYEEDVIAYPCEVRGKKSTYFSQDQIWVFKPEEGLMVNSLTGFCMTGSPPGDGSDGKLRQWPCGQANVSQYQKFKLTKDSFLMAPLIDLCVDSKLTMRRCPFSDQRWAFTPDGHIQNQLSGLCLDVIGEPGVHAGTGLVINQCEKAATTDQKWTLTPDGAIRNQLSSKCLSFKDQQGRENEPYLVLATCLGDTVTPDMQWVHTRGGFLRNAKTGKCMNVEGDPGTHTGAKVTLWKCEDQGLDTSGLWVHMANGFIRNVGNDYAAQQRCLEVFGVPGTDQKLQVGAKLHLTGCESSTDQRWELTKEGFIRSSIGGRKCLDIRPNSVSGELWMENCWLPSDPSVYRDWKWKLTPDGLVQNSETLECMGVEAAPPEARGAQVLVSRCNLTDALTGQKWELTRDSFLRHRRTGLCMDVKGNPGVWTNTPIVLWACERGDNANPATDQQWTVTPEGYLKNSLSAKCLQQEKGRPNLRPCPGAPTAQQWTLMPNGLIKNKMTGLCIDMHRNETAGMVANWKLLSWTCDSARPMQQWEQVPTS